MIDLQFNGLFGLLSQWTKKQGKGKAQQSMGKDKGKHNTIMDMLSTVAGFTLCCIFVEDVVQLVLTLLVTDGNLDQNAQLNILGSVFSIVYKLGEVELAAEANWVHVDLQKIESNFAEFERTAQLLFKPGLRWGDAVVFRSGGARAVVHGSFRFDAEEHRTGRPRTGGEPCPCALGAWLARETRRRCVPPSAPPFPRLSDSGARGCRRWAWPSCCATARAAGRWWR